MGNDFHISAPQFCELYTSYIPCYNLHRTAAVILPVAVKKANHLVSKEVYAQMSLSRQEKLFQSLLPLTPLEQAYKKLYELRDRPEERNSYLAEIDSFAQQNRMIIPGRYEHPGNLSEQTYYSHLPIGRGSNVNVVRHARYTPVFRYSTSFFELYYVISGKTHHTLAGRPVTLSAGDLLFIPPGMERSIDIFDDSLLLTIHIRHDTFDDAFFSTLRYNNKISDFFIQCLYSQNPAEPLLFSTGEDPDIQNTILEICLEAWQSDDYSWRLLNNLVTLLFIKLLRGFADSVRVGDFFSGSQTASSALAMLSYINDNYRTVSLKAVAQHFHYSIPYCSKWIREETGIGFAHFVRQVKMNHAIPLLLNTKTSIANISYMVGYESPEAFIRAFQKIYQISPAAYRKMQIEPSH